MRSLNDLCANLTEVLCARAVEVLSSRGAGASEDLPMQAGSASEHREGSASSASEHGAGRAIAPRMETSDDSSKHASKASDHLSTETVADSEHAPQKRARQQEQTPMMQHTAAAFADYGSVVEVNGLRGVLAPLELEPAEAAVSVIALERVADNLFLATVADDRVLSVDEDMLKCMPQSQA